MMENIDANLDLNQIKISQSVIQKKKCLSVLIKHIQFQTNLIRQNQENIQRVQNADSTVILYFTAEAKLVTHLSSKFRVMLRMY